MVARGELAKTLRHLADKVARIDVVDISGSDVAVCGT